MITSPHATDRPPGGRGLALVGYRGSGKSTVGKIVASRLGRPFLDADLELEARAGQSIRSIFASGGEPAFRDREEEILGELVRSHPDAVLATGGGAVLRAANRRLLAQFGFVVWLQADPDELIRRLETDVQAVASRPPLTAAGTLAEVAAVLHERQPLYAEVADAVIATLNRTPDGIAEQILQIWPR
jgi:shikimate kinase